MFPARAAPYLFGLILAGLMTFCVTAIATWQALGIADGFIGLWMRSWIASWAVAFPLVLVMAPVARRLVAKLVRDAEDA